MIREFRVEDIPAMARLHVDGWREAYAHFIPPEPLAGMSYEKDEKGFKDWLLAPQSKVLGYAADVDGEVVGFSLAGPNEGDPEGFDGEVYKLFVKSGFQNRGIGKELFREAARGLQENGYQRVSIWAFAEGRSVEFYRSLQGEVVQETSITIGGKDLRVEIFGWEVDRLERILKKAGEIDDVLK